MSFVFFGMDFFEHFVFTLAHGLMRMPGDNQHDDGAQQGSQGDRQYLRLDQVEIEHQGHAWRYEEKTEIGDEEIRQATHPFQFDDLQLQQERQ